MPIPNRSSLRRLLCGLPPTPDGGISRVDRMHLGDAWPPAMLEEAIVADMVLRPKIAGVASIKSSIDAELKIIPRSP